MGKYRKFYNTLSLKELRRRQQINYAQTQEAYQRIQEGRFGRHKDYLFVLRRLQRIALLLADSVSKFLD